jgi:hypothetical protein
MTVLLAVTSGLILVAVLVVGMLVRSGPSARRPVAPVRPVLPRSFSGLTKTQAEDLLDWLERNGQASCELSWDEEAGFTVRCR